MARKKYIVKYASVGGDGAESWLVRCSDDRRVVIAGGTEQGFKALEQDAIEFLQREIDEDKSRSGLATVDNLHLTVAVLEDLLDDNRELGFNESSPLIMSYKQVMRDIRAAIHHDPKTLESEQS